jgi:transposase
MIPMPSGMRIWLATGVTDMRRGMQGLALQVQEGLRRDPHAGDVFVFRGRRGDLVKILWHDGLGFSLYAKRLERGRFYGRRPQMGWWRSRRPSSATCSKALCGRPLRVKVIVRFFWIARSGAGLCPACAAAGTAAGLDGLSAVQIPHFDFALMAHALAAGTIWPSVRLAVHQPPSPCPS